MTRRDVRPRPRSVDREEARLAGRRLRGELAEQPLDLDRREHRVAVAEVRRVARRPDAHEHPERGATSTRARPHGRSASPRGTSERVPVVRHADARARLARDEQLVRADELVGQDRRDRHVDVAEPQRRALAETAELRARLAEDALAVARARPSTPRSAGGRNGAYASGSTAATSSGIANVAGGSSTTSPVLVERPRQPGVVARHDHDASREVRASACVEPRRHPARDPDEERVRTAGHEDRLGRGRRRREGRGAVGQHGRPLQRQRQDDAGDEARRSSRRRCPGAASGHDAATARTVSRSDPGASIERYEPVLRPTRASNVRRSTGRSRRRRRRATASRRSPAGATSPARGASGSRPCRCRRRCRAGRASRR